MIDLRKINVLVLEHIFGQLIESDIIVILTSPNRNLVHPDDVPNYSTDIAEAWEIVEHLKPIFFSLRSEFPNFHCEITLPGQYGWSYLNGSAPLVICLAALKAKGVEVE